MLVVVVVGVGVVAVVYFSTEYPHTAHFVVFPRIYELQTPL